MPLDLAIAESHPSSSASFNAGSFSIGRRLPSSLAVAGSVVSYVKSLRKLRLLAAEQLPPTLVWPALDRRDDSDHRNAQPLDLDRASQRVLHELDKQDQKHSKHCTGHCTACNKQGAVRPLRPIREVRRLHQRQA